MASINNTSMSNPNEQCKTCAKFKGPSKKVKDLWLGCEGCGEWFYSDCVKNNRTQYKIISEAQSDGNARNVEKKRKK